MHEIGHAVFIGFIVLIIIGGIGIYVLPSIIAVLRHLKLAWMVIIINVFFGWSIVAWLFCLMFSLMAKQDLGSSMFE